MPKKTTAPNLTPTDTQPETKRARTPASAKTAELPPQTTISPDRIYGFTEAVSTFERTATYEMPSHPDYVNPRTSRGEASMEVTEAVRESRRILVPILVMDVAGEVILIDGRNRLMGAAAARADDPTSFKEVPVAIFTAQSRQDALIQMAVININRENLDEMSLATLLRDLNQGEVGMSVDDLAALIGRPNRGGKRKVTQLIELVSSDTLVKAVEQGDIPANVAEQIASRFQDEESREEAVERTKKVAEDIVKDAAAEGKQITKEEAVTKAAKVTKATRANRTALTLPDLMHRIGTCLKELRQFYEADYSRWFSDLQNSEIPDEEVNFDWCYETFEGTVLMTRVLVLAEAAQLALQTLDYSEPTAMAAGTMRRVLAEMDQKALKQLTPVESRAE